MRIPDWVQEVLANFDQKKEAHGELQIVDELDRARKTHGDLSDEDFKGYVAERSAFFFRGHPDRDSVWETYFGPMAVLTRNDGAEIRVPDIKELDFEVVAHWEARARSARDPVMRARYADAIWDLKQAITNERSSHEFAQAAIDTYLVASRERLYTMEIEGVHWLKRALSLSLSIRDRERTKLVVARMFEFYDQVASPQKAGVLRRPHPFSLSCTFSVQKPFSDENSSREFSGTYQGISFSYQGCVQGIFLLGKALGGLSTTKHNKTTNNSEDFTTNNSEDYRRVMH